MLAQLDIFGLATIDRLSVAWGKGLSVITGETGAGKSVLIKALNLLFGHRSSSDAVSPGRDAIVISATFVVAEHHLAVERLRDQGFPLEITNHEAVLHIKRQLKAGGRATAWVNDMVISTPLLKELGSELLDIFAQNETHRLYESASHRHYLDAFASHRSLLQETAACHGVMENQLQELQSLLQEITREGRDMDYWQFRCQEFEKLSPSVEDYEQLKTRCEKAGKWQHIAAQLQEAQQLIEGAELPPAQTLKAAAKKLAQVRHDPEVLALAEEATNLSQSIDELSFRLSKHVNSLASEDVDIDQCQERLAEYQNLLRKFNASSVEQLVEEGQRIQTRVRLLADTERHLEEKCAGLKSAAQHLQATAEKLTQSRHTAAKRLATLVEERLQELAMPSARFVAEFVPETRHIPSIDQHFLNTKAQKDWQAFATIYSSLSERGAEKVQFLLSANRGIAPLPLQKVASGGETSRIMLAIKQVMTMDAQTCLLVFDEIDTGISGRVADTVGQRLRNLAHKFQVLCISHLAQVAAYGDQHFVVEKQEKGQGTQSSIRELKGDERVQEIARMLSGSSLTKSSLENAKELLRSAQGKAPKISRSKKPSRTAEAHI